MRLLVAPIVRVPSGEARCVADLLDVTTLTVRDRVEARERWAWTEA